MGLKEDMLAMGFGENRTVRALRAVQYNSMERAIAWLENHENDADIDDPIEESGGNVLGSASEPGQTQSVQEEATSEITPEERAAKAAEVQRKIAERRRIVEEKDKQDAIMREKIRRKEGQSLGEMREKRDRDDAKALAEDRRRQKIEDEKARKAVLDKIKQDRMNKMKAKETANKEEVAPQPAPQAAAPQPAKEYDECRLQLRLPTGQALVNSFKAEDTLGDVVAFVRDTAKLDTFGLMTSFPRKQFQPSDYGFSLKSLGLCPSSVVIVSKQ
ncbi:UBX domain-containing protein 1-like [Bolinopsis microptera]|uniref:UBX domain-containing protein 1-like n=1 Tax=Bolinopsis microptera TaxID=2820187 RepID=UPI003079E183